MRGRDLRRRLRARLASDDVEGAAEVAAAAPGGLGALVPLMYDADDAVAWRAVEATGAAAERVGPEGARQHLRRLHWLITEESGAICWRAPEAMAEIVARQPAALGDWIPIVAHLVLETAEEDLAHFRPGMLWAIGRLAPHLGGAWEDVEATVRAALDHPEPRVREVAAWVMERVGGERSGAVRP